MGHDESEVSRLLRGDVPSDDPVWGEVSGFLDKVGTVYPAVPTTAFEGRHLAAVARESRLMHSELQHPRQGAVKRLFHGTHRVLAGSVGAFLIALTAGVGVASAFGINPLGQLIAPHPAASSVVTHTTSPKATSSDPPGGSKDPEPGTVVPRAVPSSFPTISGPPASPTASASGLDDDAAKASVKAAKDAAKEAARAKEEAEKVAEKAKKEAEKVAEKAKKEAEKAAEDAAKAAEKDKGKPAPTPGKGSGKEDG